MPPSLSGSSAQRRNATAPPRHRRDQRGQSEPGQRIHQVAVAEPHHGQPAARPPALGFARIDEIRRDPTQSPACCDRGDLARIPAVRRRVDLFVRIPMAGRVASLNAAVAGSVLLFEVAGQRPAPSARTVPAVDRAPGGPVSLESVGAAAEIAPDADPLPPAAG